MSALVPLILLRASYAGSVPPAGTPPCYGRSSRDYRHTVSLSLRQWELADLLTTIGLEADLEVEFRADLRGWTAAVELDEVPWDQAMDALQRINQLAGDLYPDRLIVLHGVDGEGSAPPHCALGLRTPQAIAPDRHPKGLLAKHSGCTGLASRAGDR